MPTSPEQPRVLRFLRNLRLSAWEIFLLASILVATANLFGFKLHP